MFNRNGRYMTLASSGVVGGFLTSTGSSSDGPADEVNFINIGGKILYRDNEQDGLLSDTPSRNRRCAEKDLLQRAS